MIFEHAAWQVADSVAVADWYVAHLGMSIVRTAGPPGNARFLADATGRTVLEIYSSPAAPITDHAANHPLVLHLAFAVEDVTAERDRLLAAGAAINDDVAITSAGDTMAMLRDPWGFPIQILKRKDPMP